VSLSEVGILYGRELRAALRERNILINSVLVPLVMYPSMLWVMVSGMTFVQGRTAGQRSRVALRGLPEVHAGLETRLRADPDIEVTAAAGDAEPLVRGGDVDVVAAFEARPDGPAGNVAVRLFHDGSRPRSGLARRRLEDHVAAYREEWLSAETGRLGLSAGEWALFRIRQKDTAARRDVGAFILSLMLPTFVITAVVMGAFYPAIDATAGERERSTWESTLSLACARSSIATAKYLYVSTMAIVAGLLNLTGLTVSLRSVMAALDADGSFDFSVPLPRLLVVALGVVLIALFVSAVAMPLASFARTFREGQSLLTPFLFLVITPLYFLMVPGIKLSAALAPIPVVGVALLIRDALLGDFRPLLILEAVAGGLLAVAACLWVAARMMRQEGHVLGSYTLGRFVREQLAGRGRP
jgi:sodium transport system permease protein